MGSVDDHGRLALQQLRAGRAHDGPSIAVYTTLHQHAGLATQRVHGQPVGGPFPEAAVRTEEQLRVLCNGMFGNHVPALRTPAAAAGPDFDTDAQKMSNLYIHV